MAKRGRKPNVQPITGPQPDYKAELQLFKEQQQVQLETFYKDLAKIKTKLNDAVMRIGFMDEVESVAQAAFKAGRAYGPLDQANDALEQILDAMYSNNDFDHYDDLEN